MPRWTHDETVKLMEMKERLVDDLAVADPYPDVVGERKMIRFLRGHEGNVEKACLMMSKFLRWRRENCVDLIRREILEKNLNHPSLFPNAEKILKLVPQVVIAPERLDFYCSPISIEQYSFSPAHVLNEIKGDEYLRFIIYTLEFKSIVIEQMSELKEREYLKKVDNNPPDDEFYGVLLNICVIRDLKGVGWEHLGMKGQEIIKLIMGVATDNYPELMRKCYIVNTPWLFHTVWAVISMFIPPRTLSKITVLGADFQSTLAADIPLDNIPSQLGGGFEGVFPPFQFDVDFLSSSIIECFPRIISDMTCLDEDNTSSTSSTPLSVVDPLPALGL